MKKLFLIFIPFIGFAQQNQQIKLLDGIYITPANSSNSCICTLDQTIQNSNVAFHPFTIEDAINECTYRASEGIIGNSLTGNPLFSFGLYGGIPSAMLSDPISGNIITITTGNISSAHGFRTPDHAGIFETNDFNTFEVPISISSTWFTFYHGLSYTPNYCILIPKDFITGNILNGWYLISITSTTITVGLQSPSIGTLNFIAKYQ